MRTHRLLTLIALAALMAAGACKETVVKVLAVARVEVSGSSGALMIGQSVQLNASPRDERNTALSNRTVTWSSSNPGVASVSGSGLVQAVATGSATITAAIEGVNGTVSLSVNNPAPSISSLTPNNITVGSGAFQLTVNGSGFLPTSVVVWNGVDRTTQYVDASTLKVSIGAADVTTAGTFNVTVRNPQPGGGSSPAAAFAVNNPPPVIASLSPASALFGGAAFQLTVTGTGFVAASVVRWKGQDRATTYVNATTLQIAVAAADIATPALVDIVVANPAPGGRSDTAQFITRIPPPGPTIAARGYANCALRGNGEAYCWGSNASGQLGDGTTTDRAVPTRVATSLPFVSIVMGQYHACGLTSWGAAYCWGSPTYIGTGGSSSLTPAPVATGQAFVQLSAHNFHTCGVTAGGALYCWGDNWRGKLGDGTTTARTAPVPVVGSQTWSRVFAGYDHTCAITTAQSAYCWGYNDSGQLGDGTNTDHLTPAPVAGGLSFTSGTAGDWHTCARTPSGAAYCWGWGSSIGNGGYTNSSTPVAVAGGQVFATLDAGDTHTCGVTQQGITYCWGKNDDGQLGTGNRDWEFSPVTVTVPTLREVSGAMLHSCGITTTGAAYCWGARSFGTLGDGQVGLRSAPVAVSGASTGYTSVVAGSNFSCGLSSGAPFCWGWNQWGQVGDGTGTDQLVPTRVAGGYTFARLGAGGTHACGVTASGTAYCWGANWSGQLGNASNVNSKAPVAVAGGYAWGDIEGGQNHTCGVTTAGVPACWGDNGYGQLGDGTNNMRSAPALVTVPGGQTFGKVSVGTFHSCAVTTAGQLYCWGLNNYYQLGDGTNTNRPTPVLVDLGSPVASVSAGAYHTCALTTAGSAFCWGNGATSSQLSRPTAVAGGLTFRSIQAGYYFTCGLITTGAAYCWGSNAWGQLGNGGFVYANSPTAVAGGESYLDVRPGADHTCAVTTAGAVRCWGRLRWGELGIGVSGTVLAPTAVQGGIVFDSPTTSTRQIGAPARAAVVGRMLPAASADARRPGTPPRVETFTPTATCASAQACVAGPVGTAR